MLSPHSLAVTANIDCVVMQREYVVAAGVSPGSSEALVGIAEQAGRRAVDQLAAGCTAACSQRPGGNQATSSHPANRVGTLRFAYRGCVDVGWDPVKGKGKVMDANMLCDDKSCR